MASLDNRFKQAFGNDAYVGTKFMYDLNEKSANKQMAFQDYMSSTAHSREVNDLLNAGLNPILSANNGAATGSGAYANTDNSALTGKLQKQITNMQIQKDKDLAKQQLNWQGKQMQWDRQMQYSLAKQQIQASKYMNQYSTDMAYQLGLTQSENSMLASMYGSELSAGAMRDSAYANASATRYAASASASAMRYASEQSALASKYAANKNYDSTKYNANASFMSGIMQRGYDRWKTQYNATHPTSLGGILPSFINSLSNSTSYNPNGRWTPYNSDLYNTRRDR